MRPLLVRLLDLAEGIVAASVWLALVLTVVVAASNVASPSTPAGRLEPPAAIGARVLTEDGEGVITGQVRYADGPAWQIRLASGRYILLYRAHFQVLRPPPTPRARPVAHFHPPMLP